MNRYIRQNYRDVKLADINIPDYTICQLKYDGNWCCCDVGEDRLARYYSRTGQLKQTEDLSDTHIEPGCYIGELMRGTQWAQDPKHKGKFYIFDMIEHRGVCWKAQPYSYRYAKAYEYVSTFPVKNWEMVKPFSVFEAPTIWETLVVTGKYEGLVFRNWNDNWDVTVPRAKFELTKDVYIVGYEQGDSDGRHKDSLGAIIASGSRVGLEPVHKIGGGLSDKLRKEIWNNQELYLGRCIEVTAKAEFSSGKLRHPNFKCFRPDKDL